MKVLVAMDSFKESMTSYEAGMAVKNGIEKANPNAEIIVKCMADGGEGTLNAIGSSVDISVENELIKGPLLEERYAQYGISGDTAFIEIAKICGIELVEIPKRNPLNTSSYGVGQVIKKVLDKGCKNIYIGLGSSATNDCGIGMLSALGVGFYENNSKIQYPTGKDLKKINKIIIENKKYLNIINKCNDVILSDIDNPLTGVNGCSLVFSLQKGADYEMACAMDNWIKAYSEKVTELLKHDYTCDSGAGAAGGLGFALRAFCNGKISSGAKTIIELVKLEEDIKNADIVIVGEGCMDGQTKHGKTPYAVATLAKKHGKKVIAIAGIIKSYDEIRKSGCFDAAFSILSEIVEKNVYLEKSYSIKSLENLSRELFMLIL